MKTSFAFTQGAQPGIQSFGKSLIGAATARDNAFNTGIKELGAADYSAARAEEARAKAEGLRSQQSSLGDRLRSLMDITGLPKADLEQYDRQLTGAPVPTAPNGGEPYAMPAPERPPLAEGVMSRILQGTRQYHAQRTGSPTSTVDNIAQASGHFLAQQLQEAARDAYRANRPTEASAFSQIARPGTQVKLKDDIGSTGGVIDPATGAVTVDNPLGQATVTKLNEQAATEKFRRDQMEAAARLSNARAADITPGAAPPPAAATSGATPPGLPRAKRELTESENFALEKTATNLGISPADLKTVIQYETGGSFSPSQMGGAGGRHMGLIQFGPNERQAFGVHAGQTFEQQLGSVENYLRTRGLKPGSDIAKLYTTIIAGNPNVPPEAADQNGTIAYHLAQMTGGAPPAQAPGVKAPVQGAVPPMPPEIAALPQRDRAKWLLQQTKPSNAGAGTFTPQAVAFTAKQYLAGDRQAAQGFARNATARIALQNEIVDQATAQGMSPEAVAAKIAEFAGTVSGSRTVGQRAANISLAATEAREMIDIVKQNSAKFERTDFVPWNQVLKVYESGTGEPEIAAFGASLNALVNVYARAINPTGVPTVSDKNHAREVINAVQSPRQVAAVLAVIDRELAIAQKAPAQVRAGIRAGVTGEGNPEAGKAPGAPASGPAVGERRTINGILAEWDGKGWKKAQP